MDINTHTTHRERSLGVDVDSCICLEVSMMTVVSLSHALAFPDVVVVSVDAARVGDRDLCVRRNGRVMVMSITHVSL